VPLVAILVGLGITLMATHLPSFSKKLSPGSWGAVAGASAWAATFVIWTCSWRPVVVRPGNRRAPPPVGDRAPLREATYGVQLVSRAARDAAQRLLTERLISVEQIVDGTRNQMIAQLASYLLIQSAELRTDCTGRTLLKWNWDEPTVGDADNRLQAPNRYVRDIFNDGVTPVFPVALKRGLQPNADRDLPRLVSGGAPERLRELASSLRTRYFDSFRLGLVEGQVVVLTPTDGRPTHMVVFMQRVYATAAQELVTQFRITAAEWESFAPWLMEPLHTYAAFRMLQHARVTNNRLRIGLDREHQTGALTVQFEQQPERSRNELTWPGDSNHAPIANEALEVARQLTPPENQAQLMEMILGPLRRHRGQTAREPNQLATSLNRLGIMLSRQYFPHVGNLSEQLHFADGGGAPASSATQGAPRAAAPAQLPSAPDEQLIRQAGLPVPPPAPRRMQLQVSNPISQRDLQAIYRVNNSNALTSDQVYALMERWYQKGMNLGASRCCMFGAISITLYNDRGANSLKLRELAMLKLDQLRNGPSETEEQRVRRDAARTAYQEMQNGDYGTMPALMALSEVFQRPIHVYMANYGATNRPILRADGMLQPSFSYLDVLPTEPMVLTLSGVHYDGWRPL
jgi:hypothetical protein